MEKNDVKLFQTCIHFFCSAEDIWKNVFFNQDLAPNFKRSNKSIFFLSYNGSQWVARSTWLPTFYQISLRTAEQKQNKNHTCLEQLEGE